MKRPAVVIISMAVITVAGLIAQDAKKAPDNSRSSETQSAVLSKLQEIVALRERQLKNEQVLVQQGLSSLESPAEIDLVEARLELAREKNERDAVLAELRNLVTVHERRFKMAEQVGRDRMSQAEVDQMKVGLLKAEVRLLREQK